MPSALEQSIYNTIRYFSLFDLPVTAVQIWRSLVWESRDVRQRWYGHHLPSLAEVTAALSSSVWLRRRLGSKWGYVFIRGQEASVRRRLARHVLSQHKWRLTRKLLWWLGLAPFTRALSGSGSLALSNTRSSSDLDIFVIARRGRIWTTRLCLLFFAQLLGRRRKHWDEQAPDRLCFNHFISEGNLTMPLPVRNLYTAVAYTHLVPLVDDGMFAKFQEANAAWMKGYLMYPDAPALLPKQAISLPSPLFFLKRFTESILLEPIGNTFERWAEKIQRRVIAEHSRPGRSGRIAVSRDELAFHPDSRVPDILRQFAQEEGQKALL